MSATKDPVSLRLGDFHEKLERYVEAVYTSNGNVAPDRSKLLKEMLQVGLESKLQKLPARIRRRIAG